MADIIPEAVAPVVPVTPATPAVAAPTVVKADPVAPAAEVIASAEKWEATGDSLVDTIASGYLAKGGSVAAFSALLEDVGNSGAMTEASKVELRKTFGDMAEALIPSIEAKAKANLEWVSKERAAIYGAAGNEAEFGKMQAWAKANLDDATRAFLTSSLNLGGQSAIAAITQLKTLMIQKGATVTGVTHRVEGAAPDPGEVLTRGAYIEQRAKLERAGDHEGVAALQARARVALEAANKRGVQWR